MANLLKFKGPAPELIKIAINAGTEALFFGAAPTYTPIYFDAELLSATYGDQIFTDVANQKNMVWLSEVVTNPCLTEMRDFIKYTLIFNLTDVPGVDIPDNYVPNGNELLQ